MLSIIQFSEADLLGVRTIKTNIAAVVLHVLDQRRLF